MSEILVINPWENATQETDVVPMYKAVIDTYLPMFDDCCITSDQDPYYTSGDAITSKTMLTYRINKYNHRIRLYYWASYYGEARFTIWLNDITSDNAMWYSPISIRTGAYIAADSIDAYYNLKSMRMLIARSSSTNGFWFFYSPNTKYYSFKTFLTKVLDENTSTYSTAFVAARYNSNRASLDNFCWIYTDDNLKTDVKSYSIAQPGYSGSYILRQLRINNYLYPDIYIISGGLSYIEEEIIHIDNNTYVHLCNDIFIRIV